MIVAGGERAVILAGDERDAVLAALGDAAAYRAQLAGSCPAGCAGRGTVCDLCAEDTAAVDVYEFLGASLAERVADPPRRVRAVAVKGGLL